MTYRQAVYAVMRPLKAVMDDSKITESLALFWVSLAVNVYNTRSVDGDSSLRSGAYLSQFYPVPVSKDEKGRQYVELPAEILNISRDGGVDYITYNEETCECSGPQFAQVRFSRTTASESMSLYGDAYEKPTTTNPYFYVVGGKINDTSVNRLYFLGTECIVLKSVELGLYLSVNPANLCDLDENIQVASGLEDRVIMKAIEFGRFSHLVPADLVNDGRETINPSGGARQAQVKQDE